MAALRAVALSLPGNRGSHACFFAKSGVVRCKSTLPGKLGDPSMMLLNEPRMNKALLEHHKRDLIFGRWGIVGKPFPLPFGPDSPMWMIHKYNSFLEKCVLPTVFTEEKLPMPDTSGIEQYTEVIKGLDGSDIELYITRPKCSTTVPGIVHTHGGGMALMSTNDQLYRVCRCALSIRGFAVISVDFRNSSGLRGCHPYPTGLNDCMSGLSWAHANRERLGISKLILAGDSGGGNLCTAMALRAKREGKLNEFDGVFAMCPFIAGPEIWGAQTLTSLKECAGYFIDMEAFKIFAKVYDPEGKHTNDPCAWPLAAQQKDLEGLPPHIISVNELDPLRDEGLAYFEKLKAAGVQADKRIVEGTAHGTDMVAFTIPGAEHIFEELVRTMKSFAASL